MPPVSPHFRHALLLCASERLETVFSSTLPYFIHVDDLPLACSDETTHPRANRSSKSLCRILDAGSAISHHLLDSCINLLLDVSQLPPSDGWHFHFRPGANLTSLTHRACRMVFVLLNTSASHNAFFQEMYPTCNTRRQRLDPCFAPQPHSTVSTS